MLPFSNLVLIFTVWLVKTPITTLALPALTTIIISVQVISYLCTLILIVMLVTFILITFIPEPYLVDSNLATEQGNSDSFVSFSAGGQVTYSRRTRSLFTAASPVQRRSKSTTSRGSHKIVQKYNPNELSALELWFKQANAPVTEGQTTNPHIIAKRVLRGKTPITRDVLNSINKESLKFEVTDEEFSMIQSL